MQQIIVIGVTGSGKSTLAKKLSTTFGYPYIQLDKLFWKKNWPHPVETPTKVVKRLNFERPNSKTMWPGQSG